MTDEEALELGRRSIYAAGHRDAFSGNTINLYHVKENGWEFIGTCFTYGSFNSYSYTFLQATTMCRRCTTRARTALGMVMSCAWKGKIQQTLHLLRQKFLHEQSLFRVVCNNTCIHILIISYGFHTFDLLSHPELSSVRRKL